MASNNMDIWNQVAMTDPRHTKKVEFGRKFTAIDAHYQVMRATEVFGPVGKGWSYQVQHGVLELKSEVLSVADVTIRWRNGSQSWHEFGPVRGMCPLVSNKGKLDDDAPKKAMTDALTKALSHLGFSADVFLGKYDDNKYISTVKAEFQKRELDEQTVKDEDWKDQMLNIISRANTLDEVEAIRQANRQLFGEVSKRNKAIAMVVSSAMLAKETQLKGEG